MAVNIAVVNLKETLAEEPNGWEELTTDRFNLSLNAACHQDLFSVAPIKSGIFVS